MPPTSAPPVAPPRSGLLLFTSATASATAPNASDSAGNSVSYVASNVIDGNPATAWRVAGDGTGSTLRLSFGRQVHLDSIGLIPGYAKKNARTGADWFPRNRRVTDVRYRFDAGSEVRQTFADVPSVQTIPVNTTTSTVTITILGTTSPGDRNYTPISEVAATGTLVGPG